MQPFFSIIIPTHDRSARLVSCLGSLADLDYPRDGFEVVVVDDGSCEVLDEPVASFRNTLRLRLIRQPNRGPAAARNTGAKIGAARYLVFTDDDCLADRGWLRALERVFMETPRCLVGGAIENALPENPFSTASQAIMTAAYTYYGNHLDRRRLFSTSNLAVPTHCFHQLGGFSASFPLPAGEDYDFCDRWQHSGRPVRYAPAAVVFHAHPLALAGFLRQHFNYGRGLMRFRLRASRRAGRMRLKNPPSFYIHLLAYPLRQWPGWRGWLYGGLVAFAQLATIAGACSEIPRSR